MWTALSRSVEILCNHRRALRATAASRSLFTPTTTPPQSCADDTEWFRDLSNAENVFQWLRTENQRAKVELRDTAQLYKQLYEEMARLSNSGEPEIDAAERMDGFYYFAKHLPDKAFPAFYRAPVPDAHLKGEASDTSFIVNNTAGQLVLDPNALASENLDFVTVSSLKMSHTHRFVGYTYSMQPPGGGEDVVGGDSTFDICVRDLDTGIEYKSVVQGVCGFDWAYDEATCTDLLYFTRPDKLGRSSCVFRGSFLPGQCQGEDAKLIFCENDEAFFVDVQATKDRNFISISTNSKTSSEIWVTSAKCASAPLACLAKRENGVQYFCDHAGDRFFAVTNHGNSPVYRLFEILDSEVDNSTHGSVVYRHGASAGVNECRSSWRLVDTQSVGNLDGPNADAFDIEDIDVFKDFVALFERSLISGDQRIRIVQRNGCSVSSSNTPSLHLSTPEVAEHYYDSIYSPPGGSVVQAGSNQYYESETLRFSLSSPFEKETALDLDLSTCVPRTIDQGVMNDHNFDFISSKIWTEDGVVPMTVMHRADLELDGRNPLLLQGYGAYGTSLKASWCPTNMTLLNRGWVVVLAHVRGGGELGKPWHDAGRLLNKEQTFEDFINCGDSLVNMGYSRPDMMAAFGMSAGKLIRSILFGDTPAF